MASEKRSNGVPEIYSMLIGGLIASFVAVVVFNWIADIGGSGPNGSLVPVLTGLGCAGVLMVAGMLINDRLPWLTGGFLFASGFTALWSVALSFSVESKWVVVVALGIAIVMGIALGWWRFDRAGKERAGTSAHVVAPISPAPPGEASR